MKTFEKAFKLPFEVDSFASWIYDAKGNFCIDFVADVPQKIANQIVAIINGDQNPESKTAVSTFNPNKGTITLRTQKGEDREVLRIRGWGYLTGTGGLRLPEKEAAEIQDSLGRFIADRLTYSSNKHKHLLK